MIIPPLLTATLCLVTSVAAVQPLVDVGYTKYLGTSLSSGVTQWLGVRFAAPPLGNLRFRAPADPVKNATTQVANQVSNTATSSTNLHSLIFSPRN